MGVPISPLLPGEWGREKLHMSKLEIYSPSSAVENVCLLDIGPVPTEVVADIHTK